MKIITLQARLQFLLIGNLKDSLRYIKLDAEEHFLKSRQILYFRMVNEEKKNSAVVID